jgi:hypothetical protein
MALLRVPLVVLAAQSCERWLHTDGPTQFEQKVEFHSTLARPLRNTPHGARDSEKCGGTNQI